MKRWETISLSFIAILLFVGILFSILPFLIEKELIYLYLRRFNRTSNITAHIKSAHLSFYQSFPMVKVELEQPALVGKGRFLGDTMFRASRIVFLFDFKQIWHLNSGIFFDEIQVDSPVFNLQVDTSGLTNYDFWLVPEYEYDTSKSWIKAQKIFLNDAVVCYRDYESNIFVGASKVQAVLKDFLSKPIGVRFYLSLFASNFYLRIKKHWIARRLDFSFDGTYSNFYPRGKDNYDFVGDFVVNHKLRFWALGEFKNWNLIAGKPYNDYKLLVRADNSDFKSLLQSLTNYGSLSESNFDAGGKYWLAIKYFDKFYYDKGQKIDTFFLRFDFRIQNGWLHPHKIDDTLKNIELAGTYLQTSERLLRVDYARFRLRKNFFDLSNLKLQSLGQHLYVTTLLRANVNLQQLSRFFPGNLKLSGNLIANIDLNGLISPEADNSLANFHAKGKLWVENFSLIKDRLAVGAKSLFLDIAPETLFVKAQSFFWKRLRFEQLQLQVQGYFARLVDLWYAQANPEKLDIQVGGRLKELNLDSLLNTYGGDSAGSLPSLAQIKRLTMQLGVDWIKFRKLSLYNNSIALILQSDSLKLHYSGYLRHSPVQLLVIAKNIHARPLVSFSAQIYSFPVEQFAEYLKSYSSLLPIINTATGYLDFDVTGKVVLSESLALDMNTLYVVGSVRSDELLFRSSPFLKRLSRRLLYPQLENPTVNDLILDFEIRNKLLIVKPSWFLLLNRKAMLQGYTGFNGLLSYTLKLSLPKNQAAKLLHKMVSGQDQVFLTISIFGDIQNSKIKFGTNLLKKDIELFSDTIAQLQLEQDSIRASSQVVIDSIMNQAKAKAQSILIQAQLQANELWDYYYQQAQVLKQKYGQNSPKVRRLYKKAHRKIRKIYRNASKQHDRIIRQAKRKIDSIRRQSRRQRRRINRQIKKADKLQRQNFRNLDK